MNVHHSHHMHMTYPQTYRHTYILAIELTALDSSMLSTKARFLRISCAYFRLGTRRNSNIHWLKVKQCRGKVISLSFEAVCLFSRRRRERIGLPERNSHSQCISFSERTRGNQQRKIRRCREVLGKARSVLSLVIQPCNAGSMKESNTKERAPNAGKHMSSPPGICGCRCRCIAAAPASALRRGMCSATTHTPLPPRQEALGIPSP